jgi:hypothetical protein
MNSFFEDVASYRKDHHCSLFAAKEAILLCRQRAYRNTLEAAVLGILEREGQTSEMAVLKQAIEALHEAERIGSERRRCRCGMMTDSLEQKQSTKKGAP